MSSKTLYVDSTLEANAAMSTVVRHENGKGHAESEWLQEVARPSGIETPTRDGLATMDGRAVAFLADTLGEAERRQDRVEAKLGKVVTDKGCHSNRTMTDLRDRELRR